MEIKTLVDLPVWEWPEDAGKTLLEAVRRSGGAVSDRVLAAELAGEIAVDDEPLRRELTRLAADSAEPVALRAAAASSLGPVLEDWDLAMVDPTDEDEVPEGFVEVRALLRGLYEGERNDDDLRRRALEASAHAPDDWHAAAVGAAWNSADLAWKVTAVFCMRFVRGFETEIAAALRHADGNVVYQGASAAGIWGVRAAWDPVRALALDPKTEKRTRIAAIEAIAAIRPDEAEGVLGELEDGGDDDIAAAVDEALAMAEGDWADDEGADGDGADETDDEA